MSRKHRPSQPAPPARSAEDGTPSSGSARQGRPASDAPTLEERIEEIHDRVVLRTSADVSGLFDLLGSKRRLIWINFLSGLARGVGFFLGVSIVGGLVLGIFALTFDKAMASVGLSDITLKSAVTGAYEKYVEIQDLIGEAQRNIDKARAQLKTLPPPAEGAPPATPSPATEPPTADPQLPPAESGPR